MPESVRLADLGGLAPDVPGTAVTVGTFEGVHLGHRDVLARLRDRAAARGLASVLVTFEPHPLEIVRPDAAPRLLTTWPEKLEVLAGSGIDYVAVLPFTSALAALAPDAFVRRILLERFRMRDLLMGYDHGFGRNRSGDATALRELGQELGFDVSMVDHVDADDGAPISSTRIRRAIVDGDLTGAAGMLGRAYAVAGRVVHGEERGRLLGFPTLNVEISDPRKLLPPEGVYAVRVQTPSGPFDGMMNLGPRPTFGDERLGLEAHLFDASGDWYGAAVRLDFIARLRATQKFPSVDALVEQLQRDADDARSALAPRGGVSVDSFPVRR
jgi:riboflavin kinase/FMN adenylyltransferase